MSLPDEPRAEPRPPITVRRAGEDDLPAVLALARVALGWPADDPNEAFFRWKHLDNPAGRSPMWLAEDDGEVVGFRVFLRWRFRRPDGAMVEAVRAVDTATSPAHQRRGIFSQLTRQGVDELPPMGVSLIFNTPNDKSRPGYLKLGWQTVGRVPISVRPRHPLGIVRMARASAPAAKWSEPSTGGESAPSVLGDHALVDLLGEIQASTPPGLTTDRTAEHLRWRYAFEPLAYRALVAPGGPGHGVAVFRLRRRGAAVEGVLCELLVRPGDRATARRLVAEVARTPGIDYLIATGRPAPSLVPLPRRGPILTCRPVGPASDDLGPLPLEAWHLTMGDVELF